MGAVVYCHHGEAPHLVCLAEEGLVMTSRFLLLDDQKEVEVEEDLFVHLHSYPVQAVSQKEVEEGVRIAQAEGQEDASQVTDFALEGVAYAPREKANLGVLVAVEVLHLQVPAKRREQESEEELVYYLLMEEVEGVGCPE